MLRNFRLNPRCNHLFGGQKGLGLTLAERVSLRRFYWSFSLMESYILPVLSSLFHELGTLGGVGEHAGQ